MIKNIKKNNLGYSLLETIFYVSFFVVISILVINSMIVMMKSFKEITIQSELMQGGNILERISREIKKASDINSISASDLKLNTVDDAGNSKTVEFSLSGQDIRFLENDVFTANLNTSNTSVVALTFTQITTAKGLAVKIFLTIRANNDLLNRNENFYDTVVLRGGY